MTARRFSLVLSRLSVAFVVLAVLLAVGCELPEDPEELGATPDTVVLAPAGPASAEVEYEVPSDEAEDPQGPFEGTTTRTEVEADTRDFATLHAVRSAARNDYDRVVFELRDGVLPGYTVEYVDTATECGSGHEVPTEGDAVLTVSLHPAQAYVPTEEGRDQLIQNQDRRPGLGQLRQLTMTCDHHGAVVWALGLSERAPYRVLTLENPARLVVDVQTR